MGMIAAGRGTRRRGRAQSGHLMVGLVAAVAIMLILSTQAAQDWVAIQQRDDEAEMIFRAQEIVRAIKRFRKESGGGVALTELKQLMEPVGNNAVYVLRRLYTDPLVKDGKWGLLYQGPGGSVLDPNAPQATEGLVLGGRSSESAVGIGGGAPGGTGEMGGLPIIGVRTLCTEKPFRHYRDLTEYSQWLFTLYDLEPAQPGGPGTGAPPGGGAAQPGGPRGPRVPRGGQNR